MVDSRASSAGDAIRRRRECLSCGKRFTTYEHVEEQPLMVVKKDGRREPFDRHKLLAGLVKACEKRPVSMDDLERLVDELERELSQQFEREVPSREVGERVMKKLTRWTRWPTYGSRRSTGSSKTSSSSCAS